MNLENIEFSQDEKDIWDLICPSISQSDEGERSESDKIDDLRKLQYMLLGDR